MKMLLGLRRLRRLEGGLTHACCRIHTLSEFTRRWVEHFHGLSHRVKVIPYWRRDELVRTMSKTEARKRLGWPQDEKILFTIRHHGPRYGIDYRDSSSGALGGEEGLCFLRRRRRRTADDAGAVDSGIGRATNESVSLAG